MISNFIVQNWLEITAVIFAILYLILAVKQNILCWIAGIISSVLYFFIMQKAGLYMEAYLQVFYVVMGIYGWSQWSASNASNPSFIVNTWSKYQHMIAISIILALSLYLGFSWKDTQMQLYLFWMLWLAGEQLSQLTWLLKNFLKTGFIGLLLMQPQFFFLSKEVFGFQLYYLQHI